MGIRGVREQGEYQGMSANPSEPIVFYDGLSVEYLPEQDKYRVVAKEFGVAGRGPTMEDALQGLAFALAEAKSEGDGSSDVCFGWD